MTETTPGPARVGVRELRQNLSVYLDRVKEGEVLEVTEHGHAVALLTPTAPAAAAPAPSVAHDDTGPTMAEILRQLQDEGVR
jgi:prevent-host-death family protein